MSQHIYWIDPAECGEDGPADVMRFRERVEMALPDGWIAEIVGESDYEHVTVSVPEDIERAVGECWGDHCRYDGDPETRVRIAGEDE